MKTLKLNKKFGWLPDLPDFRDYDLNSKAPLIHQNNPKDKRSIKELLSPLKAKKTNLQQNKIRSTFDKIPIEDQGNIGSCTANAGVGLIEYFELKSFGNFTDASRLFLYKVTRNLLGFPDDSGAYLRSTMQAMRLFGVPPEEYWPYIEEDYNIEPTSFCYAFAQNFQAIKYYRLDPIGTTQEELLDRVKESIDAQLPMMFGFTVYESIYHSNNEGEIPFPSRNERINGGHAVIAIEYDDEKVIVNPNDSSVRTTGAVQIRNSWGSNWGANGYGWLPYEYILQGLARDWWSLIENEWVDSGQFGN